MVGVTETQLRERVNIKSNEYQFVGKGRSKNSRKGGGVGVFFRQGGEFSFEEIDIGDSEESEDLIAGKIEFKGKREGEGMIIIVCYMTVAGRGAGIINGRKYEIMQKIVRDHENESVMVMGDMNAHIGILGEEVNENGRLLLDFAENCQLEILNNTIAEGRVTWAERGRESAIDYRYTCQRESKRKGI